MVLVTSIIGQDSRYFITALEALAIESGVGIFRVTVTKNSPSICVERTPISSTPTASRTSIARWRFAPSDRSYAYTRTFVSTRKTAKALLVEFLASPGSWLIKSRQLLCAALYEGQFFLPRLRIARL